MLVEPPGPCGAGRLCYASVVCCAAGVPAVLMAPLVFRAVEDPVVGPGCLVCSCGAGLLGVPVGGGPPAVRAASFARRVDSLSGQALPSATGTAARPSGPSGALQTGGACVAWTSSARPRRRPPAPRPGPCLEAWPGSAAASNRAALVVCVSSWLRRCPPAPQPGLPVPPVPSRPAVPSLLCVASSCPPLNNFACNCPPAKC